MTSYFKHIIAGSLMLGVSVCVSAAEPTGYYQSCEGLTSSALLSRLQSVVGNVNTVGYDGLWELYKTSDVDANGLIWDMYSTKRWKFTEKCGNYNGVGVCYNREHSFPKSWFSKASPMYSDAYHIYPTDGYVNSQRSNYPYGECSGGTSVTSSGSVKPLGKRGNSTFPGYTGIVFEPADEYKGDFARSYFYMAAAYNSRISSWSSPMLAGNSYPAFTSWAIDLLLKWHRQDPVSQKELDRQEVVASRQGNRNPFIDHPDLAEYIWGSHKGEPWSAAGSTEPMLTMPVSGSAISFGTVPTDYSISRLVSVKAVNLSSPVSLSVSDSRFTLSASQVTAAQANAGCAVSVTLNSATAANIAATLTIKSADIVANVTLTANVVDGLPALDPALVTAESFVARWIDLGDHDRYSLDVRQGGKSIDGFPTDVPAALEEYEVDGLQPLTTYTYQLSNPDKESNIVVVTTGDLIPSIRLEGSDEIAFAAIAGEPSEPVELWIDAENVTSPYTVIVAEPFELSVDRSDWNPTITLRPDEDRVYLRVNSSAVGDFESSLTFIWGDYVYDAADLMAEVIGAEGSWMETFESIDSDSTGYTGKTLTGDMCTWNINQAGSWKSDKGSDGSDRSIRMSQSTGAYLAMATPKRGGIGTVEFDLKRWNASDGNVGIAIEYSLDGTEWTQVGSVLTTVDGYSRYTMAINAPGNAYLRLRKTSGKRCNIDNISLSSYVSAVDALSSADGWDAWSADGMLAISVGGSTNRHIRVYGLDGIMLFDGMVAPGMKQIALPAGLYVVASDNLARRVVVR